MTAPSRRALALGIASVLALALIPAGVSFADDGVPDPSATASDAPTPADSPESATPVPTDTTPAPDPNDAETPLPAPPLTTNDGPPRAAAAGVKLPPAAAAIVSLAGSDSFATAVDLNATFPGAIDFDATDLGFGAATTEPHENLTFDDAVFDSYHPTRTVWFKWKAPATGKIVLAADGSSYDLSVAVFTGSKITTAHRIAFNDNYGGEAPVLSTDDQARLTVKVSKGSTYRFQVGADGAATAAVLHLSGEYNKPAYDDFADAKSVSGSSKNWAVNLTTIGATVEPKFENVEDVSATGYEQRASVWVKWTPSVGVIGHAVVTPAAGMDASIEVYRYRASLGLYEFSDHDSGSTGAAETTSDAFYNPQYTYYFQVSAVSTDGAAAWGENSVQLKFVTTSGKAKKISSLSPSTVKYSSLPRSITLYGSGIGKNVIGASFVTSAGLGSWSTFSLTGTYGTNSVKLTIPSQPTGKYFVYLIYSDATISNWKSITIIP